MSVVTAKVSITKIHLVKVIPIMINMASTLRLESAKIERNKSIFLIRIFL